MVNCSEIKQEAYLLSLRQPKIDQIENERKQGSSAGIFSNPKVLEKKV